VRITGCEQGAGGTPAELHIAEVIFEAVKPIETDAVVDALRERLAGLLGARGLPTPFGIGGERVLFARGVRPATVAIYRGAEASAAGDGMHDGAALGTGIADAVYEALRQ